MQGDTNCQLSNAIQNLPTELREIMYKEYLTLKINQKLVLGWKEVHQEFKDAPFCKERERI